jgi:hypothetical protein
VTYAIARACGRESRAGSSCGTGLIEKTSRSPNDGSVPSSAHIASPASTAGFMARTPWVIGIGAVELRCALVLSE